MPAAAPGWFAFALRGTNVGSTVERELPRLSEKIVAFDTVPVLFALTRHEMVADIVALPNILASYESNEAELRIVSRIDSMLLLGDAHWHDMRVNGVAQGVPGLHVDDVPPYPVLDLSAPSNIRFDPDARFPTRLCSLAALNLSLQPDPPIDFSINDPVNIATRVASQWLPVVIAAGNRLTDHPNRYIRGWAEASWVTTVGATADAEGTQIASYQLVAAPGKRGPSVVAYGSDDRTREVGTSYAAPRVSEELGVLCAYLLTVRHYLDMPNDVVEGIPLAGIAYVDIDVLPGSGREHGFSVSDIESPKFRLPALPIAGIDVDALNHVMSCLRNAGLSIFIKKTADALRKMLFASARRMPEHDGSRVGHGFVGPDTTRQYLANFSGANLASVLTEAPVEASLLDSIKDVLLTDERVLDALLQRWRESLLKWAIDLRDGPNLGQPLLIAEGKGRDLKLRPPEHPRSPP